jgi:hypothetical protein
MQASKYAQLYLKDMHADCRVVAAMHPFTRHQCSVCIPTHSPMAVRGRPASDLYVWRSVGQIVSCNYKLTQVDESNSGYENEKRS